jgi:hypothetical protein
LEQATHRTRIDIELTVRAETDGQAAAVVDPCHTIAELAVRRSPTSAPLREHVCFSSAAIADSPAAVPSPRFRFGAAAFSATSADQWTERARQIENLG